MSKWDRLLERILGGQADATISFDDLCSLLGRLGHAEKISGSHHISRKTGQREIINLQPRPDGKAKPYQVEQVRATLQVHGITQVP